MYFFICFRLIFPGISLIIIKTQIKEEAMNGYELQIKRFSELTAKELYEILRLRSAVFVVEQNLSLIHI